MVFTRRFTQFPSLSVITQIEGIDIIDLIPPGVFLGVGTGTVLLVGEWPKGPVNTPIEVAGDADIRSIFGGWSPGLVDPTSPTSNPYSNGNAFVWLKGKSFARLILVRPSLDLVATVDITLTASPNTVLTSDVIIPAGTRVYNPAAPTQEFGLSRDVVFASGTSLAPSSTQTAIPVYSTGGVNGTIGLVTNVNATDLFRAGVGAGTQNPTLSAASANSVQLTILTGSAIDAAYSTAIDASLPGNLPQDITNIIASARQSSVIRAKLNANVAAASSMSLGRVALIRPVIGTNGSGARGGSDPGVGANRSDRVIYCYPHFSQFIEDIANTVPNSDGFALVGADAAMATILSNLPPENNPGQATGLIDFISALEPGLTTAGAPTNFGLQDYILFKSRGIACLRRDNDLGEWVFQSGVTSVDPTVFSQLAPISRRRMTDFLEDSMAAIAKRFNKMAATSDRKDSLVTEEFDFLDTLQSPNDPSKQRIDGFLLDSKSGNTPALSGIGIFVLIMKVRLLGSLDQIILQVTSGATVDVSGGFAA